MKKLEWNYLDPNANHHDIDIKSMLEQGSKQNNAWWKDLPVWRDLAKSHLGYFHSLSKEFFNRKISFDSFVETDVVATVKICPAIGKGILDKSFLIKSPCDIIFSINTDGEWIYKTPAPELIKVSSHTGLQVESKSSSNNPFIDKEIVKFELPIYIRTNGVPYILLHPQYHKQDFPFEVINGLVEGGYTNGQAMNVNTIIKIPEEHSTYILKKGTVLGYMWFPEKLKLTYNPNLKQRLRDTFIGFQ